MNINNDFSLEPMWVVRASIGYKGLQEDLCLKENIIAIGWSKLGDLSNFKNDKLALKEHVKKNYLNLDNNTVGTWTGEIFSFVNTMKKGDFVLLPQCRKPTIVIGKVTGEYEYRPNDFSDYIENVSEEIKVINIRKVKWEKTLMRSEFNQKILKYLSCGRTIYQVNKEVNIYLQKLWS